MGMFQPQNYGADFVQGMAVTSNMLNDRKRLESEEKRQAADQETRALQNQGLALENQKKSADLEREKNLTAFMGLTGRMQSGQLSPEDYEQLTGATKGLLKGTPYLPSDPKYIPQYKASISNLINGVQQLRTLPASNYRYTRDDNVPEVNSVLDSFQTLLSKDRLGKEFTDKDGSITGKAGETYRTAGVGGFTMVSGQGDKAAFTPLFSVVGRDGKPIVGADGRAVMVPATEGASNDPGAQVKMITPEEMLTKAGFAYRVLDTADQLGLANEDKRKDYVTQNLPQYMGEKGAELVLKNNERDPGVVAVPVDSDLYDKKGNLIRSGTPKDKNVVVPEGGKLVDNNGNVIAEGTPKTKAPTTRTFKSNGYEITQEYQGDKWVEVGREKIKAEKDTSKAETARSERESKSEIDKSLAQYNLAKRDLETAKKGGDEDAIASAQQTFEDARTAYKNRTKEHKESFGKSYNPIKEVVERVDARSITPLKEFFAEKAHGVYYRDYDEVVAKAEANGWTPEEIKRAAKGTDVAAAVESRYAPKSQPQPVQTASKPKPKGMGAKPAQAATRPPLSAFNKGR